MKSDKKILVFGVFDRLHPGHREFLRQARALGGKLYIIVAKDEMVLALKKKTPVQALFERIQALENEKLGDFFIPSDTNPYDWKVITEIKPDVIALGYDQYALRNALLAKIPDFPFRFKIVKLEPHKSDIFHTSLLK